MVPDYRNVSTLNNQTPPLATASTNALAANANQITVIARAVKRAQPENESASLKCRSRLSGLQLAPLAMPERRNLLILISITGRLFQEF